MILSELTGFLLRAVLTIITTEAINRKTPEWVKAKLLVPLIATIFTIVYSLPGIGGGTPSELPPPEGLQYIPVEPAFNIGKLIGDTIGTVAISYMLYVYAGKTIVKKIFDRIIKDNT